MGSTFGGFILGIGVFLLTISLIFTYICEEIYTPLYKDVLSYEDDLHKLYTFTHSSSYIELLENYRKLYNYFSLLENVINNYSRLYPQLMEYGDDIDDLYNFTHSEKYISILESLETISQNASDISMLLKIYGYENLSDIIYDIPYIINIMMEAREFSEDAKKFYSLIDIFPTPKELEEGIMILKMFREYIPPDRLESYLIQIKAFSEKAVLSISYIKKYPPELISKYLFLAIFISIILNISGLYLILKSSSKKY